MRAYDFDGVITAGVTPTGPSVIISGRTWDEWPEMWAWLAGHQLTDLPVYIRGTGQPGDRYAAGVFKARMCHLLAIDEIFEDDEQQARIIASRAKVHVRLVTIAPPDSEVEFDPAGIAYGLGAE